MQLPLQKAEILSLLRAENYDQALTQSRQFLQAEPDNADAHYVTGLSYLFTEQFDNSIHHLLQAIHKEKNNPVYIANLGIAFLRSGDKDKAIVHLKQAVELQPDYELAQYNLGSAFIENGQAEQAIETFTTLTGLQPDNSEYLCALADAVRETGQWLKSISLYNKVLDLDARHARAHTNMGPLMMHMGKLDEAVEHCKQAIELEPQQTLARKNLGDCYAQMEQLEEAMEAYADAYEIDSENADLCAAIGKIWLETSDWNEAASWFQKASNLDEENITAQCGLANIEREQGLLPEAFERLQPLYDKWPENIDLLLTLSDILWDDGDAEGALKHLETIQALQPQRTALYAKIGHILASAGDIDGAKKQYRQALEQQPDCIPALAGFASTVKGKLNNVHVERMQAQLENKKLRPGALASLHNGLAFYYDGSKNYKKAAEHMQLANQMQWAHKEIRGWEYDTQAYENHISQLISTFDADYFEAIKNTGNDSEQPVFIVAMPRSGTTLTEQILARHQHVLGIGERNLASQTFHQLGLSIKPETLTALDDTVKQHYASYWLDRLNAFIKQSGKNNIRRVVDKMPDNYSLIGWILTVFPRAKIIHVQRDPRDVALSCWMTQFGSIRWACHAEHLAHRIQQYQRIMQHWRNTIPERFIEVRYEAIVQNQQAMTEQLIHYLDLEWDENCLHFYESDRLIRTASITQVRQPIYKKAVARWKNYEKFIPELFIPLQNTPL